MSKKIGTMNIIDFFNEFNKYKNVERIKTNYPMLISYERCVLESPDGYPVKIFPLVDQVRPNEPTIINTDDPTYSITGYVNGKQVTKTGTCNLFPLRWPLLAANETEIKNLETMYIGHASSSEAVEMMSLHTTREDAYQWVQQTEELQKLCFELYPKLEYTPSISRNVDPTRTSMLNVYWKKYSEFSIKFGKYRMSPSIRQGTLFVHNELQKFKLESPPTFDESSLTQSFIARTSMFQGYVPLRWKFIHSKSFSQLLGEVYGNLEWYYDEHVEVVPKNVSNHLQSSSYKDVLCKTKCVLKTLEDSTVKFEYISGGPRSDFTVAISARLSKGDETFTHTVTTQLPSSFLPITIPTYVGTKEQVRMYWRNSDFTESLYEYKGGTTYIALLPTEVAAWEWSSLTSVLVTNWNRFSRLSDKDDNKKHQLQVWYSHFVKLMSKFEYSRVIPQLRDYGRICHRMIRYKDPFPNFESFPVSQGYVVYFEESKQLLNVDNFRKMVRRDYLESTEEFKKKKRKEHEEYKQRIKKLHIAQGWEWFGDY